jgi:hypothetical protein
LRMEELLVFMLTTGGALWAESGRLSGNISRFI